MLNSFLLKFILYTFLTNPPLFIHLSHRSSSPHYFNVIRQSEYFISPIPPPYTLPHLHTFSCHSSHIYLHCSHYPTLSLHMPLSNNSFVQHILLITMPYTMPKSLPYVSICKKIPFLKPLNLHEFIPLHNPFKCS